MMELNKYDLVELIAKNLSDIHCYDCPIRKECNDRQERDYRDYPCLDKDKEELREILIKKYNL